MKLSHIAAAVALALAVPVSAASVGPLGDEPIAVPSNIKQGIDFVYVDPQLSNIAHRHQRPQNWLARLFSFDWGPRSRPNPIFAQLGADLRQYEATWGRLPDVKVPAGATLKPGMTGKRVELLRTRLGLYPNGSYDEQLKQAVTAYQQVHGLNPADGIAGRATIALLNLCTQYYER